MNLENETRSLETLIERLEQYRKGGTEMSIDDKIEYWHTHDTGNSLREFLGMTEQEYLEFCLPK